jgi:hypothetical protein
MFISMATPTPTVMPTAAPIATAPATPTPTTTRAALSVIAPTATAPTPTPAAACEPRPDASLVFQPNTIDLRGAGPLGTSIAVTNNGTDMSGALLALGTTEGAEYIQSVEFANGQVWAVDGQPSKTLLLVGNVPAGGAVRIPMMVHMNPSWRGASASADAKVLVGITTVPCAATLSDVWLVVGMEPGF